MLENSTVMLEEFAENKFLPLFYEEMKKNGPNSYNKYALPSQMVFLKVRVGREAICSEKIGTYIIDRSMFEDRFIFAENSFKNGLLSEKEFEEYCEFFELLSSQSQPFNISIYLRAKTKTLVNRICKRGREMEDDIDPEYLETLNELYETKFLPYLKESDNGGKIFIYDVDDVGSDELALKVFEDIMGVMKGK